MGGKAGNHIVERGLLMRTNLLRRPLHHIVWGGKDVELPVDRGGVQVRHPQPRHRYLLIGQRRLSMRRPVIRRGDDQPRRERRFARGGEERVNVGLDQTVIRVVELALDRTQLPSRAILGHQIDPHICTRALGPVVPQPHLPEPFGPHHILGQERPHQPLEAIPLLPLTGRRRPNRIQHLVNRRHAAPRVARHLSANLPQEQPNQGSSRAPKSRNTTTSRSWAGTCSCRCPSTGTASTTHSPK